MKTFRELMSFSTFDERYRYLKLESSIGVASFGYDRYLNQTLYRSYRWKKTRNNILVRDNGLDLGHRDYPIGGIVIVHHLNPITVDDVLEERSCIFDPENLVCVSEETHRAIHYGVDDFRKPCLIVRTPNDTAPWLSKG